ncbi:MAG: hypothetical protein D6788_06775, partial [Planctomycetota bacterium]
MSCYSSILQAAEPSFPVWQRITSRGGLPDDSVRAIAFASGAVWIGTDGGLAQWDGGRWIAWQADRDLPARAIHAIAYDEATNTLWLGTWGDGLLRSTAERFDRFDQINSGLAGNLVFDVAFYDGRVWAATNAGLSVYDPSTDAWDLHFARRADVSVPVLIRLVVHEDALYGLSWKGTIWRYRPSSGRWRRVDVPLNEYLSRMLAYSRRFRSFTALNAARDGVIASGPVAVCYVNRPLKDFPIFPRLHDFVPVDAVAMDPYGRIWLGDVHGLRLRPTIPLPPITWNILSGPVHTIEVIDGRIWVGTANGLYVGSPPSKGAIDFPVADSAPFPPLPASPISSQVVPLAVFGPRTKMIAVPGRAGLPSPTSVDADPVIAAIAAKNGKENGNTSRRMHPIIVTRKPGYRHYGWLTPEDDFAWALRRGVRGIIAAIEPHDAAMQAAAYRSEIPIVSVFPVRLDPAAEQPPINPSVFTCYGPQPARHRLLIHDLITNRQARRFVIVHSPDDWKDIPLVWWKSALEKDGGTVVGRSFWSGDPDKLPTILDQLADPSFDVILTWMDSEKTLALLRALHDHRMRPILVGASAIVTSEF